MQVQDQETHVSICCNIISVHFRVQPYLIYPLTLHSIKASILGFLLTLNTMFVKLKFYQIWVEICSPMSL